MSLESNAMNFQERYKYNPDTDLIGKGGFSRVFKAHDVTLQREVALKVYSTSTSEKYDLVSEIRKVISFEHPNLCRYYDVAFLEGKTPMGETEKYQVGIMEYLDGGDLRTYVRQHPQHLNKLLKDVLEGLSYLHENGIIHRDLKPQNILIKNTPKGPVAKITDFGISKALDSDASHSSSALMGTIEYMAPEQFKPKKYGIDGKISTNLDLCSFAMLVYELVRGKSMFGGRNSNTSAEQVMSNILGEIEPEIILSIPQPYREIVKEGLIKNANERIQNAEQMIKMLEGLNAKVEIPINNIITNKNDETKILINKNEEKLHDENVHTLLLNEVKIDAIPKDNFQLIPVGTPAIKNSIEKRKSNRGLVVIISSFLAISIIVIWWSSQRKQGDTVLHNDSNPEDIIYEDVEVDAAFPGGDKAMIAFIESEIHYPLIPLEMGIQGKVYVEFIVNKDGSISDVTAKNNLHVDLEKEAIRVVSMMPNWVPGKQAGKPVRARKVIPINFVFQ